MILLLGVSVFSSIVNEPFIKIFRMGELYPFTHWKLYTMPFGNKYYVEDLRFYGLNPINRTWERIPLRAIETMNKVELIYAINFQARSPIDSSKKANLRYLAHSMDSSYLNYKLMLECYDQRNLIRNESLFDTLTISNL